MKITKRFIGMAIAVILCAGMIQVQAQGLPDHWANTDIGDVAAAGSATFENDVFNVKGSGADIWFEEDAFHYVYLRAKGDCEITAYVEYVDAFASDAKACLMVRESLETGSTFAMAVTCFGPSHGTYFQYRELPYTEPSHQNLDHGISAPVWLKLVRTGDDFVASFSQDGKRWTDALDPGNVIMLEETVYIGLGVCAHDNSGFLCEVNFEDVEVDPGIDYTAVNDMPAKVSSKDFHLNQNYPNPFNPTTEITFSNPERAQINLEVYNAQGQIVETLVNDELSAGNHSYTFNAQNLPSGVYYCKMQTANDVQMRKMVLLK